ncbi:MAG: hypothetical protein AB7H90_01095 [Alphaproteobacteria bacterium]
MTFSADAVRSELTEDVKYTVRHSPGETVKARIRSAARALGLPMGRVQDYWYGEVRRVEAHEAIQIKERSLAAKQARLARLEAEYTALQKELAAEAPRGMGWLCPPTMVASNDTKVGD